MTASKKKDFDWMDLIPIWDRLGLDTIACGLILFWSGVIGNQYGFIGLICGLLIGYVVVSVLGVAVAISLYIEHRHEIVSQNLKFSRPLPTHFPACDLRDLDHYRNYYLALPMFLSIELFVKELPPRHRFTADDFTTLIVVFVVAAAAALIGLYILWKWIVVLLGATVENSSSFSKSVEIVICYSLFFFGLTWIGVATYLPQWMVAWLNS